MATTDSRAKLDLAVAQIQFARGYTKQLLSDIQEDEWFRRSDGCPSHLAWQVGHLAMAQYGLTLARIRGRERSDRDLVSKQFYACFKKGSDPFASDADFPSISEIHDTMDRIHVESMTELAKHTDESLSEKLPEPYAVFDTKLGSVFFCSSHEMLHAGQIGLLRRMLGKVPVR